MPTKQKKRPATRKSSSPRKRTAARRGGTPRRNTRQTRKGGAARAVPPIADGVLRIVPLGGVEEIGKNMTAIEYGDDIVIVDAGFQFSEAGTPGIDYILPDTTYLKNNKHKIKALFITHGHYDHIGAIPYVMKDIGNPPIYSRQFGALIIQKRQLEFPQSPKLDMRIVDEGEVVRAGKNFTVEFFAISHAIPDSMGLFIKTPLGKLAFIEDVRVDHVDGVATEKERKHYERFADEELLLLTLDSTSVEKPGFSIPESSVIDTLDKIMKNVGGRLIIGTFASQVERVVQIMRLAEKYNKKIVVDGRSMKSNVEIVKQLEITNTKHVIPIEELAEHPPDKIVVIATGAQGEEYSVFDRIANKTHRHITLNKSDTLVFSSSVIPGNEDSVTRLKDNLYRQEARIITYFDSEVHASGHGNRGEIEWIHKQFKYRFFVPLHGHHFMLRIHAELATMLGVPEKNVMIPDNGSVIEITDGGKQIGVRKEKAPSGAVMVDGFSVGSQQELVIRDRKTLAQDGIVVIVVSLNPKTGKLRKSPDIIARGFVYVKESQKLFAETRSLIKKTIEKNTSGAGTIHFDALKGTVTDTVRRALLRKTGKSPLVIPVVIGV